MSGRAPVIAALSLGGNIGDVARAFAFALQRLRAAPGVEVTAQSSVWRTKAWGNPDQPDFLNMAALARTTLAPAALLELCLETEREQGRTRGERWGPRSLDIDVLSYGDARIDEPGLTIPHPRIAERAFVLAPLNEIAPELRIGGSSVRELAQRAGTAGVEIVAAAGA